MTHRTTALACLLVLVCAAAPAAEDDLDSLLASATTGLSQFTFDWPRKPFRAVRERAPKGSPQWQQATYGLAVCQQQVTPVEQTGIAEAAALFLELAETVPDSRFTPRSLLNLGRIAELVDFYEDPVDLDAARVRYREVATRWPADPIAGEATLRLAGSYVLTTTTADVQQAVGILDGWLAAHPEDPLAPVMWQYLGDIHFFYRNDDSAALDAYLTADRLGVLWASREGQLWWRMAVLAERLKRTEVAISYYRKICTDAQTSGRAFEAQLALARLGVDPPELTAFASYEGPRPDFGDVAAPIVAPVAPAPPAPAGGP